MLGLLAFVLLVLAGLVWWRLVKARELARIAAGLACREHGLVLMDDTVVLEGFELQRQAPGRMLALRYRFDFAQNGILNRGGSVLILTRQPATVVIKTDHGRIIESISLP